MASPVRVARRAGANLARAARRLFARAALPRGAGAWLLVRLAPRSTSWRRPRLPFARSARLDAARAAASARAGRARPPDRGRAAALRGRPARLRQGALAAPRGRRRARGGRAGRGLGGAPRRAANTWSRAARPALARARSASSSWSGCASSGFYLRGLLDRLDAEAGGRARRQPQDRRRASHARERCRREEREQLEALARRSLRGAGRARSPRAAVSTRTRFAR